MIILGIETSCDETAVGIVNDRLEVLGAALHSQVETHALYGGVVPEIASRAHIQNIQPVIQAALAQANLGVRDLGGIAVTSGPGLVGALLVGLLAAKGMAMGLGIPFIAVHHMEGHLSAPFLASPDALPPAYPFVALLVSGGHTMLLKVPRFGEYQLLGETRDDAVGEAFDKGAKMMGLGYPGGPAMARQAMGGDPQAVHFPRAMPGKDNLDFSFSGLKTALRTHLLQNPHHQPAHVAASYQEAIVDALCEKSLNACRLARIPRLVVAGGVGANVRLRQELTRRGRQQGVEIVFPPMLWCTDNGPMIACAGLQRLAMGQSSPWEQNADPNWKIFDIDQPRHR